MISRRLLVIAGLMLATSAYLRLVSATELIPPATRLQALPLRIGDWRGRDEGRLDRETEAILQADSYLLRTYAGRSVSIDLFVAYYATQRSGHTVHSPLNCLPGTGWEWIDRRRDRVSVEPGHDIEVNRNVARKGGQEVLVYYWYQSHGRAVAGEYRNKLLLVQDALTLHRSDGALVRITAPVLPGNAQSADITSFVRALYQVLTQHLPE
jgi:EpsI family protein